MSSQNLFAFFMSVYFIASCQSYQIQLHGDIYKPYCGGARPTMEQAQGITSPARNSTFILLKNKSNPATALDTIQLDDNGNFVGRYATGSYGLKRIEKSWQSEYIANYYFISDSINYQYKGSKAIELWKNQLDSEFEVIKKNKQQSLQFILKEKCFVGLNPCYDYIGPKPR